MHRVVHSSEKLMPYSHLLRVAVLTAAIVGIHVSGQTCPGNDANCLPKPALVSEVPGGAIDGTNTVFQMQRVPDTKYPIEVFRNGLPLVEGTDFQNTGSVLVLSAAQTPVRGDRLQAKYVPADSAAAATRLKTPQSAPTQLENLCRMAAVQALRSEAATVSTPSIKRQQDYRAMEGVDGLGDGPLGLDMEFDHVSTNGSDGAVIAPTALIGTKSTALRMLQERLQGATNIQGPSSRAMQAGAQNQFSAPTPGGKE